MTLDGQRVVAVVEARMTSSRLPGKVLLPAAGKPLLQILVERLRLVPRLDTIVIATTVNETDDPIVALAEQINTPVFRGSEEDVLDRVVKCLQAQNADVCVEVTGDCPLVDPAIVIEVLDAFGAVPDRIYVSNSDPGRSVPAGLDVQVFSAAALYQLDAEARHSGDREHVSYAFYSPESGDRWRPHFTRHASTAGAERLWLSLDYPEDYDLIKALHEAIAAEAPDYGAREIIAWIGAHPELHARSLARRQGWASS